ncbi:MAG TPA: DUF1579 family protein [Candidatus Angelobacter sp.]|jgi:hypothetical protein|nr:DUF1579 family protein [Candidatus Angelobacter sp.]
MNVAGLKSLVLQATVIMAAVGLIVEKPPSGLKPELASLSFFEGSWDCNGKFLKNDKKISSDMTFQPDLEGAWLMLRHDDRPPNQFHAVESWGFDKTAGRFVAVVTDNFGSVRMFTSPGWQQDRLEWTGDLLTSDKKTSQHFLFDRKGPKEFVMTFELSQEQGGWKPIDSLTCAKK